jgi:hypothetical protein
METDLSKTFKEKLSSELSSVGITGKDKMDVVSSLTEIDKKKTPKDYLKDGVTLSEVLKLVKNKRLTRNAIKKEIAKLLKDDSDVKQFLNSILDSYKEKKDEPKEATTSGSVGGYEQPLFSGEEPKKVETKEATGASSSGSYETPKMWAKSTSKKDWRGKSKTQIPGGKFVQVKKKCKKFPYCNQGDINALKIFENQTLKNVISNLSDRYSLHEDFLREIIFNEINKIENR